MYNNMHENDYKVTTGQKNKDKSRCREDNHEEPLMRNDLHASCSRSTAASPQTLQGFVVESICDTRPSIKSPD